VCRVGKDRSGHRADRGCGIVAVRASTGRTIPHRNRGIRAGADASLITDVGHCRHACLSVICAMNTWNRPFLGARGHPYPQVAASFGSWIAALLRPNPTAIHSRNPILWSCTGFLTARWPNFFLRQHRRRQPRRVIRGASVDQIAAVPGKILQQSQTSIVLKKKSSKMQTIQERFLDRSGL